MKRIYLVLICLYNILSLSLSAKDMKMYNVVWKTPSKNASGVMPIGNGDLGAGVYAIEDGDLYLLLSKNDAFNFCGDLYKTGCVKVSLTPNPFKKGEDFIQELDINTATVYIKTNDVKFKIWVDANNPVYHIEIDSKNEISINVKPCFWERYAYNKYNILKNTGEESEPLIPEVVSQDVLVKHDFGLMWYYNVGDCSVYKHDLSYYGVEWLSKEFPDPYKYRIFGNLVEAENLDLNNGSLNGICKNVDIRIHGYCSQEKNVDNFINDLNKITENNVKKTNWEKHCKWWKNFWDRSWIMASDNTVSENKRNLLFGESDGGVRKEEDVPALISQNYQYHRYFMACQGRGSVPVKFNGGIFTQQLLVNENDDYKKFRTGKLEKVNEGWLTHPDDRLWGRRFTFQNQRLLYWPLINSGDFELMRPFFGYYFNLLPHRKAVTSAWYNHEGAYYRENTEPTGMERDCGRTGKPLKNAKRSTPVTYYHDLYFTSTLELLAMMIVYSDYTKDKEFTENILVPYAREALLFFDKHYERDSNRKLCLDPSQVLETYWFARNPTPDVAGLQFCLEKLIRYDYGTEADKAVWRRLKSELPEISLGYEKGKIFIRPADSYAISRNWELGELYAIFPFTKFGVINGNKDIVEETMNRRVNRNMFNSSCWTQDQIGWAYAGNAYEAAKGLETRFRKCSEKCRFPLFGNENPDSCPDFDHLGAGSLAFQRMLLQENDDTIVLFPAWPSKWDVSFKLKISDGYVLGTVKEGEIKEYKVFPKNISKKIKVCSLQ